MVVGVLRLTLQVPESHSLKEKRMVVKSIKDRVNLKFNCAVAEVGDQDNWQSAVLGVAVVANEKRFLEGVLQKIVSFVEDLALAKLVDDEKDFVEYGDGELVSGDDYAHWEPEEPSPMAPKPGATPRSKRPKIPVRGRR